MIDQNEFFREATLQLCGHLKFEDAMWASMRFLQEVMPVAKMMLQRIDPSLNAMRFIAVATPEHWSMK